MHLYMYMEQICAICIHTKINEHQIRHETSGLILLLFNYAFFLEVLSNRYIYITLNHTRMTTYQLIYIFTTFIKTGFLVKALPVYIKLRLYTALLDLFLLKWNHLTFWSVYEYWHSYVPYSA